MTAHVFIVDENTFPVHLEYQFAGTTAGKGRRVWTPLYADIARVRAGGRVYFYRNKIGFYGPFKIDPECSEVWWDPLDPSYLQDKLNSRLIYRVKVVPDNPYPLGVSEWKALDSYLREPEKCIWSLVYRKLKGARGCTMIFPWEEQFLLELIKRKNQNEGRDPLNVEKGEHLTWNGKNEEIVKREGPPLAYNPSNKDHMKNPPDLVEKVRSKSAGSETHLQAFLTENYGSFSGSKLVFGSVDTLKWVGNEVFCGLGMQKMDLFAINKTESGKQFRIIELKKSLPDSETVTQLYRYIDWTKKFVKGANSENIKPVLLCRNLDDQSLEPDVRTSFHEFNNKSEVLSLDYIECLTDEGDLKFAKTDY